MSVMSNRLHEMLRVTLACVLMVVTGACGSVEISRGTFDGDAARDPINALLPGQLPEDASDLYYSYDEGQARAVMIFSLPAEQVDAFLEGNTYCVGLPLDVEASAGFASGQCAEDDTLYSITVDQTDPDAHLVQYGIIYGQPAQ